MKYIININYRDWELIAESFDVEKYGTDIYDYKNKLGCMIECWQHGIPIYLNNDDIFVANYLKEKAIGVVTSDPIFSIFDKDNLTFEQMLDEIKKRIPAIVQATPGDDNPYEHSHPEEEDLK